MPDVAGLSWQWIAAATGGLLCLYVLVRLIRGQREPNYIERVRALASQGEFEQAGRLQLQHGAIGEALNLFVRGEHWSWASKASERLGHLDNAGDYAKRAREWERAGALYAKAGAASLACECYCEVGMYEDAARALEGKGRPREVAKAWELAFNQRRAQIEPTGDREALPELAGLAAEVTRAMKAAGDVARARDFEKLTHVDTLCLRLGFEEEVEVNLDTNAGLDTGGQRDTGAATEKTALMGAEQGSAASAVEAEAEAERYTLLDKLGEGGMGEVFRGHDKRLDRTVALKFLPPWMTSNPMMKTMFTQEAKLAASLNHPNIITVHDFGVMNKRPFLCMELVDGVTLSDELDAHPSGLPLMAVINVARGLFKALDYAHDRGVIHRDIKPANLMVTPKGIIKLADFGIARMGDSDKTTKIVGTPTFMAPEQFRGKGVDARTDTFAAGVTLFVLLTGKSPFEGADRSHPAPSPKSLRPDIPARLDTLVQRCVALDPVYRYASDQEVLEQLKSIRAQLEQQGRELAGGQVRSVPDTAAPAEKPTAWEMMRRRSHKVSTVHVSRREEDSA